jgi:hypothetical protein
MKANFRDEIRAREDALRAREREVAAGAPSALQPIASVPSGEVQAAFARPQALVAHHVESLVAAPPPPASHQAETQIAAATPAQQAETLVAPSEVVSPPPATPPPPSNANPFDLPPPKAPSAFGAVDIIASPLLPPPAPPPKAPPESDGRGWFVTLVGLAVLGLGGYVIYAQMHAVEPTASVVAVPTESAAADVVAPPITDAGAVAAPNANPSGTPIAPIHSPNAPVLPSALHPTWHMPNNAGTLDLVAMPDARVFERSRLIGTTPLNAFVMTPGVHTLRLVPNNGRPERTIRVTIRRGQATALREVW